MDTILSQKIFSLLCKRAGENLSQREIALKLKVSPTAVSKSIKRLQNQDIVNISVTKTINFISLSNNQKTLQLKMIENIKIFYISGLAEFLSEKLAGSTIILFGSYLRGEDTINSDIDIAVIGRKPKNLQLKKFEEEILRKININFYPSWKDIHKNLKNNILNGLVIHGSVRL
ncbi:MAG: nucleotidyltransferase domain-containing protein [bacterium]